MTCPRCHSELPHSDSDNREGVCPECGIRLLRNISGVMKTSGVMIAAGGERGFYRSVQDVPEPLRTQLLETTSSPNSGIIVIADRAGKEQLSQVMARRETRSEESDAAQPRPRAVTTTESHVATSIPRLPWLAWAGFIAVLVLAAIIFALFEGDWAAFNIHW